MLPSDMSDGPAFEVLDAGTGTPQRYPRALGRQPLKTVYDVQEEQARVYRAITSGKISDSAGSKLTFVLRSLVATMETAKIEHQLELLIRDRQKRLTGKGGTP